MIETEAASGTSPPETQASGLRRLRLLAVQAGSALLLPLAQRIAPDHIGGETVDDAMSVARRLAGEGVSCTLGFWDTPDYSRQDVAETYFESVAALAAGDVDGYLSIKPPALGHDAEVAAQLAAFATRREVRLHCDAHGTEMAAADRAMVDAMLSRQPGLRIGVTLPGRWVRSLGDADWAVERRLSVRVVKGQWPDPAAPDRELRAGYLALIDRLAGRARHVAVASHDAPLVVEAIRRLQAAGTPCGVELVHAAPMAEALGWARANGVPVRIYVPFGKGFVPNVIGMLRRDPRLAWRIARGILAGGRSGG